MTSGVYSIRSVSGKEYVGSSVNVEARWATHRSELNAGKHHCHALQKAWKKYGAGSFQFTILEVCSPNHLRSREQYHIDKRQPEYNSTKLVGRPSELNRELARKHAKEVLSAITWTEERRKKAAERGRRRPPPGCDWTPERRAAQAERCRQQMKNLWADPSYQERVGKKISEAKRSKRA